MQKHGEELLFVLIVGTSYLVAGFIGMSAFKRFPGYGKLFWLLAFPWTVPFAPFFEGWVRVSKATGRGLLILMDFLVAVLLVSVPVSFGIFAAMTDRNVGEAVCVSFIAVMSFSGLVLWALDVLRTGRWW